VECHPPSSAFAGLNPARKHCRLKMKHFQGTRPPYPHNAIITIAFMIKDYTTILYFWQAVKNILKKFQKYDKIIIG